MAKKILQVIESAYRATIEEQDDTVVWFTQAIKAGGAAVTVLLRGHGVNYAVKGQDASGLIFGERKQQQPPDLAGDVARLIAKGVNVHVVDSDLAAHGLVVGDMVDGVTPITPAGLPGLLASHDLVWHW